MQRILIPVDFSGSSRAAIDYALEIYDPKNYTFVLLNAFDSDKTKELLISIDDIIESDIEKRLKLEKDHMIRISGYDMIDVEFKWEKCGVIEAIERVISSMPIELIVIGSEKGVSWVGNSNIALMKTMNFVKEINLPLLVVPYRVELKNPNEILFATTLNGIKDSNDVAPLIKLIRNCHSHLDILNVGTEKQDSAMVNDRLRQTVDGYFENVPFEVHSIESKEVFGSINDFTERHHSDLVCILYRKHNMIERLLRDSVSEQIISDLNWPLLALKHVEA